MLRPSESRELWIVAQGHGGHRMMYVRLLAEAALERGLRPVLVISPAAQVSAEFSLHLSDLQARMCTLTLEDFSVDSVQAAIPAEMHTRTVFPEGDYWLKSLALRRRKWPGGAQILVMRPHGQSSRRAVRVVQSASKAALRTVGRMRPDLSVTSLRSFTSRPRLWTVPDPVRFDGTQARAEELVSAWNRAAVEAPTYWVGVLGALNSRKNLRLVAEALASISDIKVGLVVAGNCEEGEQVMSEWLAPAVEARVSVIRRAGLLEEDELDSMVRALDCLVLAHSNEGPSGMLGKAKAIGTRVVVAGAKSLKRDARNLNDGTRWVRLSAPALADAIKRTLDSPPPPPRHSTAGEFASVLID